MNVSHLADFKIKPAWAPSLQISIEIVQSGARSLILYSPSPPCRPIKCSQDGKVLIANYNGSDDDFVATMYGISTL